MIIGRHEQKRRVEPQHFWQRKKLICRRRVITRLQSGENGAVHADSGCKLRLGELLGLSAIWYCFWKQFQREFFHVIRAPCLCYWQQHHLQQPIKKLYHLMIKLSTINVENNWLKTESCCCQKHACLQTVIITSKPCSPFETSRAIFLFHQPFILHRPVPTETLSATFAV